METRIESRGLMEFVGVSIYGGKDSDPPDRAWSLFGEMTRDASISTVGRDIYGLRIYHPNFPERFEWSYVACLAKEPEQVCPVRMVSKTLPESRYAVRSVDGGVAGIDEALIGLYRDYIPHHGFRVAFPFDFEKYCNVVHPESIPDEIELWVPIIEA